MQTWTSRRTLDAGSDPVIVRLKTPEQLRTVFNPPKNVNSDVNVNPPQVETSRQKQQQTLFKLNL